MDANSANITKSSALSEEDVKIVLQKLSPEFTCDEVNIALVGGQAVLLWQLKLNAISDPSQIVTSEDIDFASSDKETIRRCAKLLGGKVKFSTLDDVATPSMAIITFFDDNGVQRHVDIVHNMAGLELKDVLETAVTLETDDGITLVVIHPERLLEGKLAYITSPLGKKNPNSLAQLQSAIISCNAHINALLNEDGLGETERINAALKLNKRIYKMAITKSALQVWNDYKIDVFQAFEHKHFLLPEAVRSKDYPRKLAEIEALRDRVKKKDN
jgi:hypothetical protein